MKKVRTKKYQGPKYVARNVMETFFGGMSGVHKEEAQELQIKNHFALAEMSQGRATRQQWDMLMGAINIANVMCDKGIGSEYQTELRAARDTMLEVGKRIAAGSSVVDPVELEVLQEAMSIHDAQIENSRSGDIDKAAAEMERRIRHRINSTSVMRELAKEAA